MKYYLFLVLEGFEVEKVQKELEQKGLRDSFLMEEDATGHVFIGGHAKKRIDSQKVLLVEEKEDQVNWDEQWALFAEGFQSGKAHIPIGDKTLLLTPGAGFGDLSHPTTSLMLEMLKKHVHGQSVIDIGTGSGILALAALLLGAKSAIGIDIDPQALKHARQNAQLNGLKASFAKALPRKLPPDNILLMNMILPEQLAFGPERLNSLAKMWIVSGILTCQRKEYLSQTHKWGWKLFFETQSLEWCGFIFKTFS